MVKTMEASGMRDLPHWDLLSDVDKAVYRRISAALCAPSSRSKRNKRIDDFQEILEAIELFIDSDDVDKWKRCLVCGICRIPSGIALNIAQLKKLVFKCKSSINGSLKGLGYDVVLAKTASCTELFDALPQLRMNPGELRQWTVRLRSKPEEQPSSEITPPAAAYGQQLGFGLTIEGDDPAWRQRQAGSDAFDFDQIAWFDL
jgi:hypothetical protein